MFANNGVPEAMLMDDANSHQRRELSRSRLRGSVGSQISPFGSFGFAAAVINAIVT